MIPLICSRCMKHHSIKISAKVSLMFRDNLGSNDYQSITALWVSVFTKVELHESNVDFANSYLAVNSYRLCQLKIGITQNLKVWLPSRWHSQKAIHCAATLYFMFVPTILLYTLPTHPGHLVSCNKNTFLTSTHFNITYYWIRKNTWSIWATKIVSSSLYPLLSRVIDITPLFLIQRYLEIFFLRGRRRRNEKRFCAL